MARKAVDKQPAHVQPPKESRAAFVTTPRDRIWIEMRKQRRFSYESIEDKTRIHEDTVRSYVKALLAGGYLKEVVKGRPRPNGRSLNIKSEFELVKDTGVTAPRLQDDGTPVVQGTLQKNMWTAIRMLPSFDWRDVVAHASTDVVVVNESTARRYIGHLHVAGYLIEMLRAKNRLGVPARYRLPSDKNTGPRAPMFQRAKQLFDPNLGEVVWRQDAAEVFDEQA